MGGRRSAQTLSLLPDPWKALAAADTCQGTGSCSGGCCLTEVGSLMLLRPQQHHPEQVHGWNGGQACLAYSRCSARSKSEGRAMNMQTSYTVGVGSRYSLLLPQVQLAFADEV